jgi:hypothetical protein
MEKSVEHLGELGVTMMAGSGDSKGNVRSNTALGYVNGIERVLHKS